MTFTNKTKVYWFFAILQIVNSETEDQLATSLQDEDIRVILDAQGVAMLPVLQKKDSIARIIINHVLVDSTRYLLEDLKKGLETLGVLKAIRENPEQLREVFTSENIRSLDAVSVDALFIIEYAEQGSNQRASQELTIVHWRDYLQDCESEFKKVILI